MKKYSENRNLFVHDYFQNFGGGERLILNLVRKKDKLVTSFIVEKLKNFLKGKNIYSLQNNRGKKLFLLKFLTPFYFYSYFPKKKYLNAFVSGNYSIFSDLKKIKNKIFYCHSLPKIFFRYEKFYNNKNFFLKFILKLIGKIFKKIYIIKLNQFDFLIANSSFTKKHLKKYYKKKIYVVYPPIKKFYSKREIVKTKPFFLCNNRHEVEKNIDKVIKVFNNIKNYNLVITSQGSQTNILKKLSLNNKRIKFLGLVSDIKYKKLINSCVATINISREEDFGMSALEGMSAGKPAIVVNNGGYLETCIKNYNSFIINKNNIHNDLFNLIKNFDTSLAKKMHKNCIITSKKFSKENFQKKIEKFYLT